MDLCEFDDAALGVVKRARRRGARLPLPTAQRDRKGAVAPYGVCGPPALADEDPAEQMPAEPDRGIAAAFRAPIPHDAEAWRTRSPDQDPADLRLPSVRRGPAGRTGQSAQMRSGVPASLSLAAARGTVHGLRRIIWKTSATTAWRRRRVHAVRNAGDGAGIETAEVSC